MTTIEFYGSRSFINGLPQQAFFRLRSAIFYVDAAILYRTKNKHAAKRSLIGEDGSFASGLLRRICSWLDASMIPYQVHDNRYKPRPGYIRFPQLTPEPEAYIDQHLAVEKLATDPWGQGICVMPTGVGKSRALKDLIRKMGVKTVVVPPSKPLEVQIGSYLKACFGEDLVGNYDKKRGCEKAVTVMNVFAFAGANIEHFRSVDMMIADEFHHSGAAGYREANDKHWDKIYYKFGFTATNFRNNPDDQILLETVLSTELFTMTPIEAMQKGYIVPIQPIQQTIYNHDLEETGNYHTDYETFMANNVERNGRFVTFANKMKDMKVPTLILVKRVEHGRHLQSLIKDSMFINGQDEGSEHNAAAVDYFNKLEFPVLIGTSVVGEGVDTKAAGAVMLANGEKARSRIWQNIGRVVRRFPNKQVGFVFDTFDHRSKFMKRHSKERAKIYTNDFGRSATVLE